LVTCRRCRFSTSLPGSDRLCEFSATPIEKRFRDLAIRLFRLFLLAEIRLGRREIEVQAGANDLFRSRLDQIINTLKTSILQETLRLAVEILRF
jgi:hypothetical protein